MHELVRATVSRSNLTGYYRWRLDWPNGGSLSDEAETYGQAIDAIHDALAAAPPLPAALEGKQ